MNKSLEEWQYPIGKYIARQEFSTKDIENAIATLADFPKQLGSILKRCSKDDLDAPYRKGGWTIRQLVHHIADSHMHAYMRCKFAYLEERPLIKNYQEQDWAEKSPDACKAETEASYKIIEGVHQRWVFFFKELKRNDFRRVYVHPERTEHFPLAEVAYFYAWHSKHHLAHIDQFLQHKS